MEKSEQINELAAALTGFQSVVRNVPKDGTNPFFKSKYATLENTIDTVRESLVDHDLSFSQFPSGDNQLTTILMHKSGQYLMATNKYYPKDPSPQGQGSAITYMRRYALSSVLGIATEEDDDGNGASREKPQQSTYKKSTYKTTTITPSVQSGSDLPVIEIHEDAVEPSKKPMSNKQKIAALAKMLKIEVKGDEFKKKIKVLVGLELIEENYPEIINRLEIIVKQVLEEGK